MIREIRRQWLLLFPSFELSEILSPDGINQVLETRQIPISKHAMEKLQKFRDFLGVPIRVNHAGQNLRGYRSSKENSSIRGAAKFSYHMLGMAFDISVDGMSTEALFEKAKQFGWSGIGLYDTWVHIDDRITLFAQPSTWDGRKK